ncbi:MAG: hypothetical protein PHU65_00515 [Actinomycetota bacterium]|jgi:magnesium-transporting ATPase (P-type)|nr:hypothetical protein [Actinomycetota bacterium]
METVKNFFTSENFKNFWINFYSGFENVLNVIFGKIKYEPIRDLFSNPWFWIIIVLLILLSIIFRRR